MGTGQLSEAFFETDKLIPTHHSIRNLEQSISELTNSIYKMTDIAKNKWDAIKLESHNRLNQNRIEKTYNKGDIVYALDRYILPGNTRPLETKYYPSPCVVIKPLHTTTLIQQLADGFRALYSNNDIKKFKGTDPNFKNLPTAVQKVLLHDFKNLLDDDFKIITQHDELNLPEGIELYDTVDPAHRISDPLQGEGTMPSTSSQPNNPNLDSPPSEDSGESEDEDENKENNEGIELRSGKKIKTVRFKQ